MATAMNIADYVIYLANEKGEPVSNLKLQKILYFLNTIHLLKEKKPLITDSKFERWDYGPVIRDVYSEYSSNGALPIDKPSPNIYIHQVEDGVSIEQKDFSKEDLDLDDRNFIDKNIEFFIKQNPFYLVEKSHEEPQWKKLSTNEKYDDKNTVKFYKKNKFWSE